MGMNSELSASYEANLLGEILASAKNTNNSEVIEFCTREVYPLFLYAKSEAYALYKETLELRKITEFYQLMTDLSNKSDAEK